MPKVIMQDIIDTAISSGSFDTLIKALKAADLIDALQGSGPFTVFAPTDTAFQQIPKAVLDAVMEDKEQLQSILKFHVVSGKHMADDVTGMMSLETISGHKLPVDTSDGCKIGGASISHADVQCSNGVIHVIDSVLIPE